MGLDWLVHKMKPRDGHALEYHRLLSRLEALKTDELLTESRRRSLKKVVEAELERVSISAYEITGAPRIGVDPEATEWFRKSVYHLRQRQVAEEMEKPPPADPLSPKYGERDEEFIRRWSRPLHVIIAEEKGKYVPELAKNQEGLGRYFGMMCSSIDFRGQCIASAVVLPEDLRNEAYDDHNSDAASEFAKRLERALETYRREHPDWAQRVEVDEFGQERRAAEDIEVVEVAVKWLRFWSGNGFGFDGWS